MRNTIFGVPIVESDLLPMQPTPGVWARRYIRHGMADVLEWLGEEVGPKPDDETHVLLVGGTLLASASALGRLRKLAPVSEEAP